MEGAPYGYVSIAHQDTRSSATPDDVSAQIDLIRVPWLMIGEEPSAAPIGGYVRGRAEGSSYSP